MELSHIRLEAQTYHIFFQTLKFNVRVFHGWGLSFLTCCGDLKIVQLLVTERLVENRFHRSIGTLSIFNATSMESVYRLQRIEDLEGIEANGGSIRFGNLLCRRIALPRESCVLYLESLGS